MTRNASQLLLNTLNPFRINCQALSKEQRKKLMEKPTDVYVWGNGIQVDSSLDYQNYYPKKLKNFSEEGSPQIIIARFGHFHEAYLDKDGKVHIWKKHKMTSIKLEEIDDCCRPDMHTIEIKGKKIIDISFSQNRLFALTSKGEVFLWKIEQLQPTFSFEDDDIKLTGDTDVETKIYLTPLQIKELKNIIEIDSGTDHFIALDKDGNVWAMGDDTFGQCGQDLDNRPEIPPFKERRYGKPVKVKLPKRIQKICSGHRHNFAIDDSGRIYGWGYNHQQQLSHSEEFANETLPKHAFFEPVLIEKEMEGKKAINASAGGDFSLIVTENKDGVQNVLSTGNNLRGQLGINRMSHLQDISKVEDISGFVDTSKHTPLKIGHISWGRRHSMAVFDYGAFYIWGDNEFGQLGDRKRRIMESPYPKAKFELKHRVLNIEASLDNWAVIVERLSDDMRDKDNEDEKLKKK